MDPEERREHVRHLARGFAATLEHVRSTHGVDYVSRRSMGLELTASPPVGSAESTPSAATVDAQRTASPREPSDRREQAEPSGSSNASPRKPSGLREQAEQWPTERKLAYLRDRNIGDCQRCALCQGRRNIVFGVGDPNAGIMFVGEAPGAEEDRRGEPFVGRAGQRLDQWIEALGLRRSQVYIANVLKCRPPQNRDPRPEEVDRCSPFLKAQIRAIAPRVIVALGRHAGMLLSRREDMSLRAMRSARLSYDASARQEPPGTRLTPLVVTYHPAYVLRQESNPSSGRASPNAMVLEDLRRAVEIANRSRG